MKPLSNQVFDVLSFMDCHPGGSIAGAVNATSDGSGRDVFEAFATQVGMPFADSATGAALAVAVWEDASTGYEIRAALRGAGWAERSREQDREAEEQVTRELVIAARQTPEEIAAELAWWQANPSPTPDPGQAAYEDGLRALLHRHAEAATPVPVDLADEQPAPVTRSCEMAGCKSLQATEFSASGIVYLCPDCRALVERMAAELRADEQSDGVL